MSASDNQRMDPAKWKYDYFMALAQGNLSRIGEIASERGVDAQLSPTRCTPLFESYMLASPLELTSNPNFTVDSFKDECNDGPFDDDDVGIRPLHVACGHGQVAAIEYLIANGADVNARTPCTRVPPIQVAVLCRKTSSVIADMCATLVRKGASLEFANNGGLWTPLHHAVHLRSAAVVGALLSARRQHPDTVRAALGIRNDRGNTPLQEAVGDRATDCAALLVEAGCDVDEPNAYGVVPLLVAVQNGDAATAQVLLRAKNGDVNATGTQRITALAYAAYLGNDLLVSMLLAAGADAERCCDTTPLMSASSSGHQSVVRLLIEGGAQVNRADGGGFTALHYATREGNADIVRLLLESGAADEACTADGNTPLALACRGRHAEIAALLIERRPGDVNCVSNEGDTPLSYAAYNGDLAICKLLVDRGAVVATRNGANVTPVWNAAYGGHIDVLAYLIDAADPPMSVPSRGRDHRCGGLWAPFIYDVERTPLYVAVDQRHRDVVELLLGCGGVDMRNETWYWSGDFPDGADAELMKLVICAARNTASLSTLVANRIRRVLGSRLRNSVSQLQIPALLRGQLLLCK